MKRFTPVPPADCPRGSHHIGVQLVVVAPEPFGRRVETLVGVLPRAWKILVDAAVHHVLRSVTLADLLEQPLPDELHQLTLGLELGPRHHRAGAWDERRPGATDPAQPSPG